MVSARRFRLTASMFGEITHRRQDTPPDNLVLRILQQRTFKSVQTEWGIVQEPNAIEEYKSKQQCHYPYLTVSPCGFFVGHEYPFIGATPDGRVCIPFLTDSLGLLEIKFPYSQRNTTPLEAYKSPGFCCEVGDIGSGAIKLRRTHRYYAQVQGQMAIGGCKWCDFVIYTKKGIAIERINFDPYYWNNNILPKLINFYDNILVPEIVSPVHHLGLPIRNLVNIM